jgi:processive 1,2-diacylglycerol beta-glucosyltransferase
MTSVLILHASLGSGHVSAAKALQAAFARRRYLDVQVADVFDFGNTLFREAVTKFYERVSEKAPQLWKVMYESSDQSDLEDTTRANKLRAELQSPFVSKLDRLVEEVAPEVIIGTHFMPVDLLLREKERNRLAQPIYTVITDFMAHSNWVTAGVDGYFLAADETRDALIHLGVPPDLLHVTGIPVRPELGDPKDTAEMRAKHGLPLDRPVVALFGGGIRPERVRRMVARLVESQVDAELVVVAGRSESLVEALEDVASGPHMRLRKLGRINFVDDLIAASDLVITKAGGLIVSEILARGTPLIIIDPIPGQEEWNADYVVGVGAGMQFRIPEMVPTATLRLLGDPERLDAMRRAAAASGRPHAALAIADQVIQDMARL